MFWGERAGVCCQSLVFDSVEFMLLFFQGANHVLLAVCSVGDKLVSTRETVASHLSENQSEKMWPVLESFIDVGW